MAVVRTYDYHDDRGILVYQVCRTEPKGFFQRRPGADHKEWINGVPANIRTIFRLPQLVASPEGKTIYITEGEKDVLAIVDRGNYVATCNTCGAGKWPHDHDHYFENHPVIIIADKDEPGRKHARNVAEGIALAKAKSVKIIEVPGAGKDATDFLEAGGTIDELDALAAATPEYIPTPKPLELPDVPDILDTATPEATTAKAIIPRPAAKAAPAPSSPENQNLESTWQNILLKTMATQKGTGWMGKCPAHNDGKASLSLARGEDGRILMKCFAGCEFAEITKALQIESCSCFPPIAKRGTQPPEPPDAETLNYAQYYQPREWQINREAVPAIIATVNDFLCAELQQEPSIATLAASLWCATAIIGKRVAFTNRGNRYYCTDLNSAVPKFVRNTNLTTI